jgi:hypothetical protein
MSTLSNITASDGWFIGEDKSLVFTIYDANGAAQDITGWTISWKLSATLSGAATLTKTASLTTPASGICTVAVAAGDTSGMTPGTYYYTLRRTNSGSAAELAYGFAELLDVYVNY